MHNLDSYVMEVLAFQKALRTLITGADTCQTLFERHPEMLQQILEEVKSIEDERAKNLTEITTLEENAIKLRSELESTKSILDMRQRELDRAENEIENQKCIIKDFGREADEWESKANEHEKTIEKLEERIKELEFALANSQAELEKLKTSGTPPVVNVINKIEMDSAKTKAKAQESRLNEILQKIAGLGWSDSELSSRCRNADCPLESIDLEKTTGDCPHKSCPCRGVMPEDWKKVLAPFREGENQ